LKNIINITKGNNGIISIYLAKYPAEGMGKDYGIEIILKMMALIFIKISTTIIELIK